MCYFEEVGFLMVIMGCVKDIVEYCGVLWFLFSDFFFGNSVGKLYDLES